MKITIGYDGSDSARDAVRELHRAGMPGNTKATVVSVADVWPRLPAESFTPADAAALPKSPIARKARVLAEQAIAEAHALVGEGGALVKGSSPVGRSPKPRMPARPTKR